MSKPDFEKAAQKAIKCAESVFKSSIEEGDFFSFENYQTTLKSVIAAELVKSYRLGQMSRIDWPSEDQIHQAVCEHTAYNSEFAEGFESACEWLRSRVTGEGEK
jgi:hypothetical protein